MREMKESDYRRIETSMTLASRSPWSVESYFDNNVQKYRVLNALGKLVCDDCNLYDASFIADTPNNMRLLLNEVEILCDKMNDVKSGITDLRDVIETHFI